MRDASSSQAAEAAKAAQHMLQQQLDAARAHSDAQAAALAAAQGDCAEWKAKAGAAEVLAAP